MKNSTLEIIKQLKLTGMADAYNAIMELPINKQPDAHQMIARLIDAEQQFRSHKRMQMFIRLSKLRFQANIQDIKCSTKRNLTKDKLAFISDCSWIDRAENMLVTGATGCGKSYLSCAIGHNACVNGYRTIYFNLNRFIEQIAIAKADGSLIKWMNRIQKAKLIILDDFGLQQIDHSIKLILLQILEDRYEKASVVVCSQIPVNQWYQYLNEPTIADAIMDRLIPKAHRIELKGNSMRKEINKVN